MAQSRPFLLKEYVSDDGVQINAANVSLDKYNFFRGWEPEDVDEDSDIPGYLVEFIGHPANTAEYEYFIGWVDKDVFECDFKEQE